MSETSNTKKEGHGMPQTKFTNNDNQSNESGITEASHKKVMNHAVRLIRITLNLNTKVTRWSQKNLFQFVQRHTYNYSTDDHKGQ